MDCKNPSLKADYYIFTLELSHKFNISPWLRTGILIPKQLLGRCIVVYISDGDL